MTNSYFIAHEADHRIAERHAAGAAHRRLRAGAVPTRRRLRDLGPALAGLMSRNAHATPAGRVATSATAAVTTRATV